MSAPTDLTPGPPPLAPTDLEELDRVLAGRLVSSVYQPIVDLDTGAVVAYEALARGPEDSPLRTPDRLFGAAARAGRTAELDWVCRTAALRGAVAGGLAAPFTLFVNLEPAAVGTVPPADLVAVLAALPPDLRVVVEFTERALIERPAELLRTVERVRELGWGVAVDDVGAERESLALMPFLRPDVIKLDLRLVQQRTTVELAEVVNAVAAEAARTGATVLAEGIETEEHVRIAASLGARLGQGWHFGRPGPLPAVPPPPGPSVPLHTCRAAAPAGSTPYRLLVTDADGTPGVLHDRVRRSTKPLLVSLSKHLEQQALAAGELAVVVGTFQRARHVTPATCRRYATLAQGAVFVAALAEGLDGDPVPGVRGAALDPEDPLVDEWDLVVVGPHFAGAVVAHDLGDSGPDSERRFDYVVTYDREQVLRMAASVLARVQPRPAAPVPAPRATTEQRGSHLAGLAGVEAGELPRLLERAVAASTAGIAVADARHPDQALVYVNPAFERITGFAAEEVLGRNCRFLQGPGTDSEAVRSLRALIRQGREATTTLVNHRRDGSAWWNELHIAPVHDARGRLTHLVGVQNDVTARVEAEQRAAWLAGHDALTGLANRTRLAEHLTEELGRARRGGAGAVALLFLDLDDFKAVNDTLGHAAGDALLVEAAERLRGSGRRGDLLVRLGGDEFLVVVHGAPDEVGAAAARLRVELTSRLTAPYLLGGHEVHVGVSVGVACLPTTQADVPALLAAADAAMYAQKRSGRVPARLREPSTARG